MSDSSTEPTNEGQGHPSWQRAVYKLGRDFESLLTVVPVCYLTAEAGDPFPRSISGFAGLIDEWIFWQMAWTREAWHDVSPPV